MELRNSHNLVTQGPSQCSAQHITHVCVQHITHVCVEMLCKHTCRAASRVKVQHIQLCTARTLDETINDYVTGLCICYAVLFIVVLGCTLSTNKNVLAGKRMRSPPAAA